MPEQELIKTIKELKLTIAQYETANEILQNQVDGLRKELEKTHAAYGKYVDMVAEIIEEA